VGNKDTRGQANKRKRNNEPHFHRSKGCEYLAEQGFNINSGTWTDLETIVLITISEILEESPLQNSAVNSSILYRNLASSLALQNSGLPIGQKTSSQISGKIMHMKKLQEVHVKMVQKEIESQKIL
jgi:hypothetical protein